MICCVLMNIVLKMADDIGFIEKLEFIFEV